MAQTVKHLAYNAGDLGSIPGSGRSSGEGNDNQLQYTCLENPMTEEHGGLQSTGSQRVRHDSKTIPANKSIHYSVTLNLELTDTDIANSTKFLR